MEIDTKKCPFCAETINAEAIKCKFCGEFLNTRTNPEKEKVEPRLIEQKDYSLGIFLAFLAIVLSFLDTVIEDNEKLSSTIIFFALLSEIRVWIYFRQYMNNFNSNKIKRLINWNIVILVLLGIFTVIVDYLPVNSSENSELTESDLLSIFLFIYVIVLVIAYFLVYIKLGIALQKIKNDFVGLLKVLGVTLSYFLPFAILADIFGGILDNQLLNFISTFLGVIPLFLISIIFIRSKKYMITNN